MTDQSTSEFFLVVILTQPVVIWEFPEEFSSSCCYIARTVLSADSVELCGVRDLAAEACFWITSQLYGIPIRISSSTLLAFLSVSASTASFALQAL